MLLKEDFASETSWPMGAEQVRAERARELTQQCSKEQQLCALTLFITVCSSSQKKKGMATASML
eukprot:5729578-Amphidinium_carterae.1